jgi:hypothetical protein
MIEQNKVVVVGDVTIDWIQWGIEEHEDCENLANWQRFPGLSMSPQEGGALQLANMIKSGIDFKKLNYSLVKYEINDLRNIRPEMIIHSNVLLDKYPYKVTDLNNQSNNKKYYRIKKALGYTGPVGKIEGNVEPQKYTNGDDNDNAKYVVIDDAGNGFRHNYNKELDIASHWPKELKSDDNTVIILKTCKPLCDGDLWKKLFPSCHNNGEGSEKNIIVIVNANDLRDEGLNISRRLSWEKSSEDFARHILKNSNSVSRSLHKCNNLIVCFGVDGVIHYSYNGGKEKADLYYDPNISEDSFKIKYPGDMQGLTNAFVAHFAITMIESGSTKINEAISDGIKASRRLFKTGFGEADSSPQYQYDEIFSGNLEKENKDEVSNIKQIPIIINGYAGSLGWTILKKKVSNIDEAALKIVQEGPNKALTCVPIVSFGDLTTLDRLEIESYQSIKNLMLEYIEKKDLKVPLSIAVFGSPGSGKSFGISELAKNIAATSNKKIKIEIMEFNVAQFRSPDDLNFVFHKVRDSVLEGKIPLVFFDEFDCHFENKLGWLKYFLSPMQDGKFREGETIHPIGKSIFIFAGGTGSTFIDFSRENIDEKDGINKLKQDFIDAKGPDFVSRLKGYVDIQSIDKDKDEFYKIRRAIILRNCLKKKSNYIFEENGKAKIDTNVIKAFLNVEKFKHGVRSMKAIIEMSLLADGKMFNQSMLPPREQLELHVNADKFLEELDRTM